MNLDTRAGPASYSTAEVAQKLGVSVPTVQRWVDSGFLKAWKTAGGHRRVDAASVHGVLAAQRMQLDGTGPQSHGANGAATPVLSVLLVDDNPDDRDILSALIEATLPRARVTILENGFDALVAMGRAMPDLLLTDIVMPHMNGLEMLRHLSARATARPRLIVAVSSKTEAELGRLGGLPEGVPLLSKPVEPARFQHLVAPLLPQASAS
jgi:excisionase family DNA binding protein